MTVCRTCNNDFYSFRGKPGFIDQCTDCANDVPLLGGNMIWEHKTAPSLEIKSLAAAKNFAKLQRRHGAGPLKSITQGRESVFNPGMKRKTGSEPGAGYSSRLNEKRSVKR